MSSTTAVRPPSRIPFDRIQTTDSEPRFDVDGVSIVKAFLDSLKIQQLNVELDSLFATPVINQNHRGSIWRNTILKEISSPSTIHSLNLLELALDVFDVVVPAGRKSKMILTNVEIFSEQSNPTPVFWHTDQRRGMIRAQVYLKGGTNQSGAFLYMRGTHRLEHLVEHRLHSDEIEQLKGAIVDCSGQPGDLISFDAFGFHSKTLCVQERRTIMFEFQDVDSPYLKSSIDLNSAKISERVKDNFDLFRRAADLGTYGAHGLDAFPSNEYVPFRLLYEVNRSFVIHCIKSAVRGLKRVLRPK